MAVTKQDEECKKKKATNEVVCGYVGASSDIGGIKYLDLEGVSINNHIALLFCSNSLQNESELNSLKSPRYE